MILGRHGNFHQFDFSHLQILREKGAIAAPADTTLVLFDWHENLDNFPEATPLTSASWAYLGLERDLYANLYLVGTDPRGVNEINPWRYEEELRSPVGEILKKMDRVAMFPFRPSSSLWRIGKSPPFSCEERGGMHSRAKPRPAAGRGSTSGRASNHLFPGQSLSGPGLQEQRHTL